MIIDDVERITEIAARPGMSGMTPGEHQAIERVRVWVEEAREHPDEYPESTSAPEAWGEADEQIDAAIEANRAVLDNPLMDDEPVPESKIDPVDESDLIELLGDTGEELMLAGFENLNSLQEATDDDILAVKGIGPVSLRQIREVAPKIEE